MFRMLSGWNWRRILLLLVLPNFFFFVLASATQAPFLIVVENVILIGFSAAICIAFLPEVIDGFRVGRPLTGRFTICLGLVGSWADWLARAVFSLVWRGVPTFKWIVDSDINSAILFWTLCAGVCHLLAPQVIDGRVPGRKWMRVGIITGVLIVLSIMAIYNRPIVYYMRATLNGEQIQADRFVATAGDQSVIDVLRHYNPDAPDGVTTDADKGPFSEPLQARISRPLADRLEQWRADQSPIPSKSAAVRHLLGEALDADAKAPKP